MRRRFAWSSSLSSYRSRRWSRPNGSRGAPACAITGIEMLAVDVEKRLGDFRLVARFESNGAVTALFGSSGAGKTSIINMVAGLVTPDRGRIALDDDLLF